MQVRIRLGLILLIVGGGGLSRLNIHHGGLNLILTLITAVGLALVTTDIVTSRAS